MAGVSAPGTAAPPCDGGCPALPEAASDKLGRGAGATPVGEVKPGVHGVSYNGMRTVPGFGEGELPSLSSRP